MKKPFLSVLSVVLCAGLLASCGASPSSTSVPSTAPTSSAGTTSTDKSVELNVFAAASLTETFEKIAELYKTVDPNVTLNFTFDSSGTLKTQIQEGADCDIFISAAQKQMDQLDAQGDASVNTEGLDFVDHSTRFNFVQNQVVLVVPNGNPAGINSFSDLSTDKLNLIALGNDDVPVGAYSTEILKHLGILDSLQANNKITYGSNVKEVTTQVAEDSADCGIIYATDAFSAGLTVVDKATPDMCSQVVYPAAALKNTPHPQEAKAFLDFLKTNEQAHAILEEVGFTMVQ